MRLFRPKLKVCVFKIDGELLQIHPIKNLQFSGWVAQEPRTVNVSELENIKVYNFYTPATGAGMYWLSITFKNKKVVEYNFDNYELVKDSVAFFKTELPQVNLEVDERIKT
jgi:hypothetical protein